jgi:hypothetical protein
LQRFGDFQGNKRAEFIHWRGSIGSTKNLVKTIFINRESRLDATGFSREEEKQVEPLAKAEHMYYIIDTGKAPAQIWERWR